MVFTSISFPSLIRTVVRYHVASSLDSSVVIICVYFRDNYYSLLSFHRRDLYEFRSLLFHKKIHTFFITYLAVVLWFGRALLNTHRHTYYIFVVDRISGIARRLSVSHSRKSSVTVRTELYARAIVQPIRRTVRRV